MPLRYPYVLHTSSSFISFITNLLQTSLTLFQLHRTLAKCLFVLSIFDHMPDRDALWSNIPKSLKFCFSARDSGLDSFLSARVAMCRKNMNAFKIPVCSPYFIQFHFIHHQSRGYVPMLNSHSISKLSINEIENSC